MRNAWAVTFNLDPLKLVPPERVKYSDPTADQPHQGKSMHVNGHEVTTKDISGVYRGISRKLSDWFSSVCLGWPMDNIVRVLYYCPWLASQQRSIAGLPQIWILTLNLTPPNFCIQSLHQRVCSTSVLGDGEGMYFWQLCMGSSFHRYTYLGLKQTVRYKKPCICKSCS